MCMKLSPTKLGSTYFQATRLTTKSNGVIFNCSSVIIKIAMKKNQSLINKNGGLTTQNLKSEIRIKFCSSKSSITPLSDPLVTIMYGTVTKRSNVH